MKKRLFCPTLAPEPSTHQHAIIANGFLFCTAYGIDANGHIAAGDVTAQTRQSMENMAAILAEAELTVDDVVKVTVHLVNKEDIPAMNQIYFSYFPHSTPMRCCVVDAGLFGDILVEFEIMAATH